MATAGTTEIAVVRPIGEYQQALTRFQTQGVHPYHRRAVSIIRPDDEIRKAIENRPFEDLAYQAAEVEDRIAQSPDGAQAAVASAAEEFLRSSFPMLVPEQLGIEIDFSLGREDDDPDEFVRIEEMIRQNAALGFQSQATENLPQMFRAFSEVRGALRFVHREGFLTPHTIIPESHLPWVTIAAPVWYVRPKEEIAFHIQDTRDTHPDNFVRYMVDLLGTEWLADWYQIWNRRSRPFSAYRGDVIPQALLDVMQRAVPVFDYLVIATPYHDVASMEWADPAWQRMIDPYLLGFSKYLRGFFFFLGRWSDTGIFPLAAEMTAHTMAYLRTHLGLLDKFNNPYWACPGGINKSVFLTYNNDSRKGTDIIKSAQEALQAYDEGRLFPWITEGRPSVQLAYAR